MRLITLLKTMPVSSHLRSDDQKEMLKYIVKVIKEYKRLLLRFWMLYFWLLQHHIAFNSQKHYATDLYPVCGQLSSQSFILYILYYLTHSMCHLWNNVSFHLLYTYSNKFHMACNYTISQLCYHSNFFFNSIF